ncbi:DMT family transporter [Motilimonas sp. 1_MG-2023]|uniref:DMT family transporter n=1 Tax=Motilimonas sp. 1_MG-2023 TaxID=3062672 RepID=UPI0026E2A9A4|nr:DMT family transporter [Motilimonas sp. 1_MG-2023]MDO6524119.1 DMT family transporter [Motilimonas sp. 1_MG-2023]
MPQSAYFLPALSALFWSGNFVFARYVSSDIPPIALAYWRWTLAMCLILPFAIKPIWQQRAIIKAHFWPLFLLSTVGVAGFNTCVYLGLQTTTATNGLLINSMIPILIIVCSLLLGVTIQLKQGLGVLISLLGVIFLVCHGELSRLLNLRVNTGDLWVLLATLLWAIYSIGLKVKPAELSAVAFLGFSISVGSFVLSPLYWFNLTSEASWHFSLENGAAIGYTAIFASLVAYFCWNQGVKLIGASTAGQFIHLMPVFGTALAVLFIGEQLAWFQLIGALAIGSGILLSLQSKPSR